MPRSDLVSDVKVANSLAENAAKNAKKGSAGIRFTKFLGAGGNASVFQARMLKPAPVFSTGCKSKRTNLEEVDPTPAVKIFKHSGSAKIQEQREYALSKWADHAGLGPPVFCEAHWDLGSKGVYHLIFMQRMGGDLLSIAEDKSVNFDVKQMAWSLAFEKVGNAALKTDPPVIGMDIRPENFLVRYKNNSLEAVFISDWDPKFWRSFAGSKEALLFNYLVFVSNSMFPPGGIPNLCEQFPFEVRHFADRLVNVWSSSPRFERFLEKWGAQLRNGVYHYAKQYNPRAYMQALKKLQGFYGNFKCNARQGLYVKGGSGQMALKFGEMMFEGTG